MNTVSDIQELNRTHSLFHKAFDQVKARRYYFVSLLFSGLLISLVIWFSHTLSIQHTEDVVDKALKQALTVFALDRGLDAAISVLSSTTVGVGVNVNMGALLDPIDSIIEDFATVLQWAIGALVLQKLLLSITFNPVFMYLMYASGFLVWIAFLIKRYSFALLSSKIFLSLTLVKLSIVMIVIATHYIDDGFIGEQIEAHHAVAKESESFLHSEHETNLEGVSTEQKQQWKLELDKLKAQEQTVLYQIFEQELEKQLLESELMIVNQSIKERNDASSVMNRFTSFWRSDAIDHELAKLKGEIDAVDSILHDHKRSLTKIQEDIQRISNEIDGKPNGFLDSVSKQATATVNKVTQAISKVPSYDELKDRLEVTVDALVKLMALFLIKSIIMPILFLYLLFVTNKLIWRISLPSVSLLEARSN